MPWSQHSLTAQGVCPHCGHPVPDDASWLSIVTCRECGEIFSPQPVSDPPAGLEPLAAPPAPPREPEHIAEAIPLAPPPEPADVPDNSVDLSPISQFGNQEIPSGGASALVYDVTITGFDQSGLLDDVLDSLADSRLGLSREGLLEMIRSNKSDELHIKRLNPVRAAVIVQRLKSLPVNLKWTCFQLIKGVIVFALAFLPLKKAMAEDSWGQHEVNLKGYVSRMNALEQDITDLIVKKNQAVDSHTRDQILEDIHKKDDDLRNVMQEFKAEEEHVRFEHPEKGEKILRKYRHVRLKSLSELEKEVGIDGQLSRLKNKVESTYDRDDNADGD